MALQADEPGAFVLVERKHRSDPYRYSVQLLFIEQGHTHRLLRAGSKHLSHTNRLEQETITDNRRINRLTGRYQEAAAHDTEIQEDGYAVSADAPFSSLASAREHVCRLAAISPLPQEPPE